MLHVVFLSFPNFCLSTIAAGFGVVRDGGFLTLRAKRLSLLFVMMSGPKKSVSNWRVYGFVNLVLTYFTPNYPLRVGYMIHTDSRPESRDCERRRENKLQETETFFQLLSLLSPKTSSCEKSRGGQCCQILRNCAKMAHLAPPLVHFESAFAHCAKS